MPATYLRSAGMGRLTGSVVRPWRLTLLVAGLSMFGPLSIDAILPAFPAMGAGLGADKLRSEEHTSELPSLMRISYAVFCLKKKHSIHTYALAHVVHNSLTSLPFS